MLIPNSTIWETQIQTVDALLTASAGGREEVYYLATVCQVGIDPPQVSVSPNPEYPICDTIERAGFFAVNFLTNRQSALIHDCKRLDKGRPDKLAALGLEHELSDNGTPQLLHCLQSLECRVDHVWDSGDHRTFIGEVVGRRVRVGSGADVSSHRFGGSASRLRSWVKAAACLTGLYDLSLLARGQRRTGGDIESGTAKYIGEQVLWSDGQSEARAPTDADSPRTGMDSEPRPRRIAPRPPGVCLVGCGWWGQVHALKLKEMGPGVRRFFASRTIEKARDFAHRFDGEDAFAGLSAALADERVDAVVLALPHHVHAEAAIEALAADRHVLVEKPLALSIADARRVVEAAEASSVVLAVSEQYRLSPLVKKARDLIGDGLLGRVTAVQAGMSGKYRPSQSWKQTGSTMGGGVLLDVGVHYIDVLRYLFGEPSTVWATRPPQLAEEMEGEDSVAATLTFESGVIANLFFSWSAHRSRGIPNIEVIGERGSLGLWFSKPYLLHTAPLPGTHWASRARQVLPWRVSRRVGRFMPRALERQIHVDPGDLIGSRAVVEDFVTAITTGTQPAVPGREGMRDLQIVKAAYRALETNSPQAVDIA